MYGVSFFCLVKLDLFLLKATINHSRTKRQVKVHNVNLSRKSQLRWNDGRKNYYFTMFENHKKSLIWQDFWIFAPKIYIRSRSEIFTIFGEKNSNQEVKTKNETFLVIFEHFWFTIWRWDWRWSSTNNVRCLF